MKLLLSQKAFTLLEVMLSIAILSFISILTATSIQSSIKFKAKTISKIEDSAYLQDALKIMAEDIRLAFNYKDINIEVFNLAQDVRKKRAEEKAKKKNDSSKKNETTKKTTTETGAGTESNNFAKKEPLVITHFLGGRDKLDFTSLSYSRTIENSGFSNQAEIGYFLKDCRGRLDKTKRSQCLWRRVSPVIDDKIDEGGVERVLLENVDSLVFRYIGPENEEEWRQDWFTDEKGDTITKGVFPYAVEITIEVKAKKEGAKSSAMTIVAPISFPNNQKDTKEKVDEKVDDPNSNSSKK